MIGKLHSSISNGNLRYFIPCLSLHLISLYLWFIVRTGFGLPGTDIGHFMCASRSPDSLSFDGSKESELIDAYYSEFCKFAHRFGAVSSPEATSEELLSRQELQCQYENGVLDTVRCVFGYQWLRVNASPKLLERNASSLARNAYNKSIPNAIWLVAVCDSMLRNREKCLVDTSPK